MLKLQDHFQSLKCLFHSFYLPKWVQQQMKANESAVGHKKRYKERRMHNMLKGKKGIQEEDKEVGQVDRVEG